MNDAATNPPPRGARRHVVATVGEIEDGGRKIIEVGGREIGIFRVGDEFHALRNRCPHKGGPLCRGEVIGLVRSAAPGDLQLDASSRTLVCPWHNWEFDLATGQSYWDPQRMRARRFSVGVEPGGALTAELESATERTPGPYVAEVISVSVEDDYVVVTMRDAAG